MKKTLQKIITIALIGGCLTSSLFAEKGRDFKNTGKPHIEHKMMPGLMKFEELKGVVKVEEKDNAKKIYVYTSANKRVLVETVRKFDYEKKPYKNFDKKDFPKMNNKEFLSELGRRLNYNMKEAKTLSDSLIQEICLQLEDEITIAISGFGNFEVKKKLERVVVNPATKQRMLVPPKMSVSFKVAPVLKDKANEK